MRVYRTSVKEDINVGNVFQHLAENYVNQVSLEQLLGVWGLLVALIGSLQCVGSRDQLSTVCPDDGTKSSQFFKKLPIMLVGIT